MPQNAPPPWLMFMIMFGLISLALGVIILIGGVSRVLRGEPFWPREHAGIRPAGSGARSVAMKGQFSRANTVRQRSPHQNAKNEQRSAVQPFSKGSNVQPPAPAITADLPTTVDEVQRLAHTIALYAKRPNKELAILEAWGETKGDGPGYQRASRLFDTAMTDTAKQAAKAKPPQIAREVETA